MRHVLTIALLLLCGIATHCQNVSADKIQSGCSKASVYDKGINLTIHVMTTEAFSDKEIENTLAKDISRFKDTNQIKTGSDPQRVVDGFDATVFWSEIKMQDGNISGYVASFFVIETCGTFDNGSSIHGFSTHVLLVGGPSIAPQRGRDNLLDLIEKRIYDLIVATVRKRRTN